jgi:hypothetical protein
MRHVVTPSVVAALFACGGVLASLPASAQLAAPASAASSPAIASTAGPAPQLSAADQKRAEAIQQYQHDLVNVVALRADPDYLLGAAILARPFKNQTPGLDFDSLSQRAATAPDAGAAARWVRLDLCAGKDDCPNAKAFDYLKKNAADNAAVWIVAMDVAAESKNAKAEQAALEKAAAAQTYDDYYGKALAGVAKAVEVLPPLADTTQGAHGGQPDNGDGVRVLVAASATQNHLRPNLKPVVDACTKEAVAKHHQTRQACLKLAHTLAWGSSPIARAVGLHIQGELQPAKKSENDQAARNVAWQVHAYSSLLQRALTDQTLATQWLTAARNGGTELSLVLATLRANNVSTDAPADAAPASAGSSGR